jgi:PST family polysaccharide transporter
MARTRNFELLFKVIKWSVAVAIIGAVAGVFLGPWVIALIFGKSFEQSYPVLLVLLAAICLSTPSVLLGYPLLGALGKNRTANNTVLIGGAIQILLLGVWFMLGLHKAPQIAVTVCIVELIVLSLRVCWGRRAYKEWAYQTSNRLGGESACRTTIVSKAP